MIHYQLHKNLTNPQEGECTQLVLRDSVTHDIVAFAVCVTDDSFIIGKRGDENFDKYVKVFKLDNANNRNRIERSNTDNN